jgi:hypothetical protein
MCALIFLHSWCFTLAIASLFSKESVMAHAKSLEETKREISAMAVPEIEIVVEETPTGGRGEVLVAFEDEGPVSIGGEFGGSADEGASSMTTNKRTALGLRRLPPTE